MKSLLLIALVAISSNALAHNHEGKEGKGVEHKAEIVKHIDEKIAKLQEHKTCVTAAADNEALKKCHEAMKEHREEMREERKEKREERKAKRKERKENKQQQ